MPANSGMMQNFLRMTGLFGPQDDSAAYEGMPSELPVAARGTQPIAAPNRGAPGISIPGAYSQPDVGPEPVQGYNAQVGEDPNDTLAAFKQNVMNPPKRTQMTYPKNTLAGLEAALKIAAEPSPLAKNRVWVNGKAHQKQSVRTDPVTGEKQYITNVHEPAFMDQVMRAMPASVSAATDILNQPREDAMEDWDLKNKGLAAVGKAESEMALAGQRRANAEAIPERVRQGDEKIDISRMTAEEKVRASRLNTMTDAQKQAEIQSGRATIADMNNAAAMARLERGGEIRSGQIDQQGDIRSGQIEQQGNIRSGQITQQGNIRAGQIDQSAEQARATKAAPGTASNTNQSHTQQRQAAVNRANEVINAHPEWKDMITIDPDTKMPVLKTPRDPWGSEGPDFTEYDKAFEAIYGRKRGASAAPVTTKPSTSIGGSPPPKIAPVKAGGTPIKQYSKSRNSTRISTDGGKTWKIVEGRQ